MKVQRLLASNHGVITLAQARHCGLSDDQIARKVASGEWIRRAPGVYFAIAWAWTPAARVRVAAEWVRPTGALAGPTAAWWLGLDIDSPAPVSVVVPPGSSRRPPSGVRMARRDLRGDRVEHRGLWCVARALAVLDAAVVLGVGGQAFLDRALQQKHVTLEELRSMQARHLGRRGSRAAHDLLVRAGDRAASEVERRTVALLRGAAIDGWAYHVDPARFVEDRARKRALVADGWLVVEVTWDDLVRRPQKVVDELRRIIALRSAGT